MMAASKEYRIVGIKMVCGIPENYRSMPMSAEACIAHAREYVASNHLAVAKVVEYENGSQRLYANA